MWISKKEYECLVGVYNESVRRDVRHLEEIRTVESKYLGEIRTAEAKYLGEIRTAKAKTTKLGEALELILPDELKPIRVPFPISSRPEFDFQAILDAAKAVKRAEKRAEDKEILKLVKAMREKA